jgi:hypothetical protein
MVSGSVLQVRHQVNDKCRKFKAKAALSSRRDILVVAGAARTACPRRARRRLVLIGRRNCGRKHVERDPLVAFVLALGAAIAFMLVAAAAAAPRAIFAVAVSAIATVATIRALLALRLDLTDVVGVGIGIGSVGRTGLGILILIVVAIIVAALTALLLEARAILAEHAEIVIRILQIIFGLDAVALHLRVARHAFIFLEQLRRVAALPVILAIARIGVATLRPSAAAATAPATALTIVDQTKILTNGGYSALPTGPSPAILFARPQRLEFASANPDTSPNRPPKRPSNRGSATSGPHAFAAVVGPVPGPLCSHQARQIQAEKH